MTFSVPPPQWFLTLERALRDRRLPLAELTCRGGLLRIVLGDSPAPLTATVRRRDQSTPGWGQTHRFTLGYAGTAALSPVQEEWMTAVVTVLERLERHIPAGLGQTVSSFAAGVAPPHELAQRYAFCTVEESDRDGVALTEILVRTTDRCNQRCPFCSGPPTGHPTEEVLRRCLEDAARAYPGAMLTLTGGEPTLRREFVEEVAFGLALPRLARVQIQTNAVAFATRLAPTSWPASDRLAFFVSLQALSEELYDRCTGTRGQLGQALAGTRALIDAGHRVFINIVVNRLNVAALVAYVQVLRQQLPWPETVVLHFSTLTCPEFRPEAVELIVPYAELAPALERAHDEAVGLGLHVQSLRSSTHASLPACVLGSRYRDDTPRRSRPRADETGYEDLSRPWVKARRCAACREAATCLGVPRAYATKVGLAELTPLLERR
jgi:pyruvate-formate lyase-activating enzyme